MESPKKIILYVSIVLLAIVVAVLIGSNSLTDRNKREEKAAQTEVVEESEATLMKEKINTLQKENDQLKTKLEKVEELEEKYNKASDAVSEMKNIHALYKASRVTEAVEAFKLLETEDFGETENAYYRLLRDYINK